MTLKNKYNVGEREEEETGKWVSNENIEGFLLDSAPDSVAMDILHISQYDKCAICDLCGQG